MYALIHFLEEDVVLKNQFIAFRATKEEREKVEQLAIDFDTSISGVLSMLLNSARTIDDVTALTVNGTVIAIHSTQAQDDEAESNVVQEESN